MELFDQRFHSRILVQALPENSDSIAPEVGEMLGRHVERRYEERQIALVTAPLQPNNAARRQIHGKRVERAEQSELIHPGLALRGKREQRGRALPVANEHAQLIEDLLAAERTQLLALVRGCDQLHDLVIEEFGQSRNPVTD